jgi:hypothetical protein
MFRPTQIPPVPTEELMLDVATHSHTAREWIELRDHQIRVARRLAGIPLAEIAEAAGLSVARVKQIVPTDGPHGLEDAGGPPILGPELPLRTIDTANQPWGIREIAPDIPTFESERAFLTSRGGQFGTDLGWDYYDTSRSERFLMGAVESPDGGIDVYAVAAPEASDPVVAGEVWEGSLNGPCFLLGNVQSWAVLERGFLPALPGIMRRPGALAWAYMRTRWLTEITDAAPTAVPKMPACASCGVAPNTAASETSCNEAESAVEPGWTFTAEESYCPICADVRAHTWGARRQDDEPKGKKR